MESLWIDFVERGPEAFAAALAEWDRSGEGGEPRDRFALAPGDTLASVLADYEQVAARTGSVVGGLTSLDDAHPLPPAPWFEPGATWSARRVLLHILAETSQHAGHADLLRESLDGQKTMG